jgi:hypothetical protein
MPEHRPKHDDFVDKVVADAKAPPNTLLLTGFVGKAAEDGHTRLYLDPELREYVDIPNDAILHSKAIPEGSSPLGGSFVWINRDAEVVHGSSIASRFKARFLEGRIATAYGAAAAAMHAATPQQAEGLYISHPLRCIITAIPGCETMHCVGQEAAAMHRELLRRAGTGLPGCGLGLPYTGVAGPQPPWNNPRGIFFCTGPDGCGRGNSGLCGT